MHLEVMLWLLGQRINRLARTYFHLEKRERARAEKWGDERERRRVSE